MWYHRVVGGGRCPIVDTWWQTETGGIMMSPLPGAITTKPGSCTKPVPGIVPVIVDETGNAVGANQGGWLVIAHPWPGMLRGIWGDDARYQEVYWSKVPHHYLAGDNARCDDDGYYWIMGRIDDVLNVSGHRLSTIEIESALVSHAKVAEAAAVGRPDELKGEAVAVFVTLKGGRAQRTLFARNSSSTSARKSAALAQPDDVRFTSALPENPQRQDYAPAPERTSPRAKKPSATLPRWRITACWRSSERTKNKSKTPANRNLTHSQVACDHANNRWPEPYPRVDQSPMTS